MTEYDNIKLEPKREFMGFSWHTEDINSETPEITVYCEDREHDLINGLVHELTEATITTTIKQLENINCSHEHVLNLKNNLFSLSHLLTVYSMNYYSIQFHAMLLYESLFKMRTPITRSVRP